MRARVAAMLGASPNPERTTMKLGAFSISLAVKNLEASRVFYRKLGFTEFGGDAGHGWLILKNGDHVIGLFQGMFEKNMLTFNPGWNQDVQELDAFADVREIQRHLKSEGVEFLTQADEGTTGPASFIVVDPEATRYLSTSTSEHRSRYTRPLESMTMTNTQRVPHAACVRLADHLQERKAEMIQNWAARARADSDVLSNSMTQLELIDHVPKIFDALLHALRNESSQTPSEVQEVTARHTAISLLAHGNARRRPGESHGANRLRCDRRVPRLARRVGRQRNAARRHLPRPLRRAPGGVPGGH